MSKKVLTTENSLKNLKIVDKSKQSCHIQNWDKVMGSPNFGGKIKDSPSDKTIFELLSPNNIRANASAAREKTRSTL